MKYYYIKSNTKKATARPSKKGPRLEWIIVAKKKIKTEEYYLNEWGYAYEDIYSCTESEYLYA